MDHDRPSLLRGVAAALPLIILAAVVGVCGWLLSRVCLSELGALFGAEALLIALWVCARRPIIGGTYLYLLGCGVLMARETVLAVTGGIPCGMPTFANPCREWRCAEYNHIPLLGIQTSCKRQECVRTEREEVSETYASREGISGWLATALVGSWLALFLSFFQIRSWRARARSDEAERGITGGQRAAELVAVILAVPVTYGLCALHALRTLSVNREDTWQAEGMMNAAELYSAIGLFAFHRLLIVLVDRRAHSEDKETPRVANLQRGFHGLIAAGVKQYVILVFGCNALQLVAKTWSWMRPTYCQNILSHVAEVWFPHHEIHLTLREGVVQKSQHLRSSTIACEDLWNTVSLLMVVANFFTCSIALYALLRYEHTFTDDLRPEQPFWKFWGVKGLLSVNFLQRILLMAFGMMATGRAKTSEEFRTFLNFYLVCIESAGLAALNVCAYAPSERQALQEDADFESQVLAETSKEDSCTLRAEIDLPTVIGKVPLPFE